MKIKDELKAINDKLTEIDKLLRFAMPLEAMRSLRQFEASQAHFKESIKKKKSHLPK